MLISKRAFPQPFPAGTGTVYLARGDVLADALAAGSLTDGPVILVPRCGTPPASVVAEVTRLNPDRVVALGTDFSVCDTLLATVAGGRDTDRFGGPNRYATALLIADERARQGPVTEVYLASGADTAPDVVAGGSLTRGPILTLPATEHPSVAAAAAWVAAQPGVTKVIALGGIDRIPDGHLTRVAAGKATDRIAGPNRYATAAGIAAYQFGGPVPVVYLARGDIFADAVSAGAFTDGPTLLTASCALPQAVRDALQTLTPTQIIALGSQDAVCDRTLHDAIAAVPPPGVQLSEETTILDEQDLARLTSYDPATGTIVFADPTAPAPAAVGDIVVAGYTETVPTGFLRRVTGTTQTPQGTRLSTTEATLPEALADTGGALVEGQAQLLASYVEPADGVTIIDGELPQTRSMQLQSDLLSAQAVEVKLEHTLRIQKEFKADTDGENFTGTGALTLDATVKVGGTLAASVKTTWFTLEELLLKAGPTADASISGNISGELKGTASPALGKITRFWNIQLGPLPVVVVEETDMTLEADVTTSGKIGVTTGVTASTSVGVHYKNGTLDGILDAQGTATPPSLEADATASVGLSIGPQTDIRVYGVAGLKSKAGPWAQATATITGTEPLSCILEAGLKAELAAVAGINILGLKAELEQGRTTTLTLLNEELCQTSGTPPPDGGTPPVDDPSPPPRTIKFTQVAAGAAHSLGLTADGRVYSWGLNGGGLCCNEADLWRAPREITDMRAVPNGVEFTQIAAGHTFSLALGTDGHAYTWSAGSVSPVAVDSSALPAGVTFTQLVAGHHHSLGLGSDGRLYAWGLNNAGQLGDGSRTDRLAPVPSDMSRVPAGVVFTQLAASQYTSRALGSDGKVYGWGSGQFSDLPLVPVALEGSGLPPGVSMTQVAADASSTYALGTDGRIYDWSNANINQTFSWRDLFSWAGWSVLPPGVVVERMSGGWSQFSFSASNGHTYMRGLNDRGQLGDGTGSARNGPVAVDRTGLPTDVTFTQVEIGIDHSVALGSDGIAYAWGGNQYGQVGDGSALDRWSPVAVQMPLLASTWAGAALRDVSSSDYSPPDSPRGLISPTEEPGNLLVGAVLANAHDAWQVADRRYLSEASIR